MEDANGYVEPNPVCVEEDDNGYMRVDKRLELDEDEHQYLQPVYKNWRSQLLWS